MLLPNESMRGPGLRSTLDVRRLWRCPSCGYERHLGQTTTSVMCFCKDPPLQMKLVEGKRVTRPEPRPVARFIDESELPPDDSPPAPVRIETIEVTETVIVVDATVETVVASTAPAETDSEQSRNKKRRRRQRGRREGSNDAPTGEGASPDSPAEPPASSGDADFGAGIEP